MNCLWCDEYISEEIKWNNFFILSKSKKICYACEGKLIKLQGNRCKLCSRMIKEQLCNDCIEWSSNPLWKESLIYNHSIFLYNEEMQEIIAKWKYRGDFVLAEIFSEDIRSVFNEKFLHIKEDAIIIPIPLSDERLKERGFNQAKALADFLPQENVNALVRTHSEKQSKKTRYERIISENPFTLIKKIDQPVILIDDIYTTGTTLRHAGKLLKENGCPKVYGFSLIRS